MKMMIVTACLVIVALVNYAASTATVKAWKQRYGKSDTKSFVQTDTPDETVFAKSLQTRIAGGTTAEHGDIPWQARVDIFYRNGSRTYCGASIIDQFWLVSAAHCFTDADRVTVTVGTLYLREKDNDEQTFTVNSRYRYIHEEYDNSIYDNDIALLRITPSNNGAGIVFNKLVQPIRLPDAGTYLRADTMLLVSGWGLTETQEFPKMLLKAEVPIIDEKECKRLNVGPGKITKRMVCAGYKNGQIDTCRGDSGGPAAYKQAGRYVLYGIVSWGYGCALPKHPGVYTRVTEFLPWIEDTMRSNDETIEWESVQQASAEPIALN